MAAVVKGLEKLRKNLSQFLDGVELIVAPDALVKGAQMIQGGMSQRAPRRTGQLAGDIEIEVKFKRGRMVARIGPSPESFYARFLEFGTRTLAARPFMRPTIDADGPRAVAVMGGDINTGINAVTKRLDASVE